MSRLYACIVKSLTDYNGRDKFSRLQCAVLVH